MKEELYLSVDEVAELLGKHKTTILRMLEKGSFQETREDVTKTGRVKYLISLNSFEDSLKQKYFTQKSERDQQRTQQVVSDIDWDKISSVGKSTIDFWIRVVEWFLDFRRRSELPLAETDEQFVVLANHTLKDDPSYKKFSLKTLYKKKKLYEEQRLTELVDKRSEKRSGNRRVDSYVSQVFFTHYLNQSKPSIQASLEYTELQLFEEGQEELLHTLPSIHTFRRLVGDLNEHVKIYGREGEKAFMDKCGFYIKRDYSTMASNDYWIGDTHTLDVFVQDNQGKQRRLYLSAWMDARSGVIVGYHLGLSANSYSTLLALRNGIEKYGIPKEIYVDNGREFLNLDIGGLGHRAKKSQLGRLTPPTILKRLGVDMTNALVRNARAKTIERRFLDVKERFSKLFLSYTGGNVLEKPERLKNVVKMKKLPSDVELKEQARLLIEYDLNLRAYGGEVEADRGKRKIDVFVERLKTQRRASVSELSLMLMRTSRTSKVGRRGISVKLGTPERLDYYDEHFVLEHFGESVYVRYDPSDLSHVRVYNLRDEFLAELSSASATVLTYGASQEEVKDGMRKVRKSQQLVKEEMNSVILAKENRKEALDLVLEQAKRREQEGLPKTTPEVIQLHRANEKQYVPQHARAVGENEWLNFDEINERILRERGKQ